ncbi:MAG: VOC family protein [Streptosporangiales bacterium]|nr:VOC family protein [Streptosporangiales bacterium]MBO0890857.1 VOC family protein [Acidothermales bacterium]
MSQTIFPALRYRDAAGAIEFLTKAFGFTEVVAYRGDDGMVEHAQLDFRGTSIMLGQRREGEYDEITSDVAASACYVVVADTDAHFAHARAGGARIVKEPYEQDYGSRDYTAEDPEGNVWTFGTYPGAQVPRGGTVGR